MKKLILAAFAIGLLAISCNPEAGGSEKSVSELTNASSDDWDDAVRTMYNEDGTIDSSKLAKFEWEAEKYHFGTVVDGEIVEYSYKFKNTGGAPLIIESAKGSCGCTVPERPEEPIAPGEMGEIKVKFNSEGRVGQPIKHVTLIANTLPRATKLELTGNVVEKK